MRRKVLLAKFGFTLSALCFLSFVALLGLRSAFPTANPAHENEWYPGPSTYSLESGCEVRFNNVQRKLLLNRSLVLHPTVIVPQAGCRATVEIRATAFEVKPVFVSELLYKQHSDIYFSVLPKEPGEQSMVVIVRGAGVQVLYFNVYQYPFIPPNVSIWFPILSVLLAGLGIPWFVDQYRKRKEKRDAEIAKKQKEKDVEAGDA